MVTIKFAPEDADNMPTVLSKIYNISGDDYEIVKSDGAADVSGEDEPGSEPLFVAINDEKYHYEPKVFISLENNGIEAYMSIYPPLGTATSLIYDEIKESIAEEGVKVGIDEDAIRSIAEKHKEGYVVLHKLFAKGIEPIPGRDASLTMLFNETNLRPKIAAGGKADYKNIDNIMHAKKGDVLITRRPATLGVRGLTVKNAEIPPVPGKDVELYQGEGVMLNPLGTQYVALCDGYVEYKNNVLAVHEIYYINGDVDYSIGNVSFSGTVHVKGDVLSGFRVEAKKDIIVDGICGDCEMVAHGSILIKTGIKGNDSNVFMAKENVVVGYTEKAKIYARNNIVIKKYSYNSDLYAGNSIDATSGEGIIAGGNLKAYSEINAKQLGTQGNSKFSINIGTRFYKDQALDKLRKQRARVTEVVGQITELLGRFNLLRPEVANNPKVVKLQDIKRQCEALVSEMSDKEEEFSIDSRAEKPKIKIKGIVYEGLSVSFFNSATVVRERIENVVFYLDDKYKEVAWVSLKDAKNFELD